jgi:hypothetical protein
MSAHREIFDIGSFNDGEREGALESTLVERSGQRVDWSIEI